jgi:UDP-glucose 4-epimerase
MKRLLLLGGFGFLGTNILKFIDNYYLDKYSVVVFDKYLYHPYNVTFKCVEQAFDGDFLDNEIIEEIFIKYKIDIVLHAISTIIPQNSGNVRFDIDTNIIPTINLLNLLVKYKIANIVFFSSGGAIYGDSMISHKEIDDVFPVSSYGIIKLIIEKYLFMYKYNHNIFPLILRISNPYGPYHYSNKQGIVNIALNTAINGNRFTVWGDGKTKKDFIFVEDVCYIVLELIGNEIFNEVINISSGEILSLNKILTTIKEYYPEFFWEYSEFNKYDIKHLELSNEKLRNILGKYKPTPFKRGLLITKEWIELQNYILRSLFQNP